ncbi:Cysteine-rich secretory protein family protein [Streptomyces sp. YIM 130001]|uniref:CAP domain-containing protein n=1 Tax=Streptomyces sp. YIM 130001 TaxID=2259644 RepID=UPI000E64AB6D|nr:CAP domain-containing protein [Streptomyces sp. YIM 130001]RII09546.1 Cysteine-rich secretory protein family protein [Streptomyces sp. YIM 130001]
MGRHRRSDAGPAGAGDSPAPQPNASAKGAHRHRKRGPAPVRTGLLGVSAAVALGAVAVASGLVPGADNYSLGGGGDSDKVQSADGPSEVQTQGAAEPSERSEAPASRGSDRPTPSSSSPEPSKTSAKPSRTPSQKPSAKPSTDKAEQPKEQSPSSKPAPRRTEQQNAAPQGDGQSSQEAQVLALVNQERSKAGCSPVRQDGDLATLAADFSKDMAARGFFDHTDPDGDTPWDRAKDAGVSNLGGENIARGQANAQSVMDSWMNSDGHRANILNCDYKTLGVGAHMASGGPWWTQDFGF